MRMHNAAEFEIMVEEPPATLAPPRTNGKLAGGQSAHGDALYGVWLGDWKCGSASLWASS